jgi:uncharacterized membrane-anchored protein
MMISLPVRILGATALLIAGLCGLLVNESVQREQGTEVALRIEGVDPRNLLTGHSVNLQFADTLAGACPPGLEGLSSAKPNAQKPWLALKTSGERTVVVGGGATRDTAKTFAPLLVQGTATCEFDKADGPKRLVLDIGINRFHAAQKEAEALELALRGNTDATPFYALVSIGSDGRARLKGLRVNSKNYDLAWW